MDERFTNQVIIGSNYIDLIINRGCQRQRDINNSYAIIVLIIFNMQNKLMRVENRKQNMAKALNQVNK